MSEPDSVSETPETSDKQILHRKLELPFSKLKPDNDPTRTIESRKARKMGEQIIESLSDDDFLKEALLNKRPKEHIFRCLVRHPGKENESSLVETIRNIREFGCDKVEDGKPELRPVSETPLWKYGLPDSEGDTSIILVYDNKDDVMYREDFSNPLGHLKGYVEIKWS